MTLAEGNETVTVQLLGADALAEQSRFTEVSQRWYTQAELLRSITHPGVARVREHFVGAPPHPQDQAPATSEHVLYLVTSNVEGVEPHAAVSGHDPRAALPYLEQAAGVLDWLHSGAATPSGQPVLHGEISPSALVIGSEGYVVLTAFGMGAVAAAGATTRPYAAPGYAAPETAGGLASPAADRYAFGALTYAVLSGEAPPAHPEELRARMAALPAVAHVDPQRRERLLAMVSPDPSQRPPALEWIQLLSAPTAPAAPPAAPAGTSGAPPSPGSRGQPAAVPPPYTPARSRSTAPLVIGAAILVTLALVVAAGASLMLARDREGAVAAPPDSSQPSALRSSPVPSTPADPDSAPSPPATVDLDQVVQNDGSVVIAQQRDEAPVVELYVDFQCPYCAQFHATSNDTLLELAAQGEAIVHVRPVSIFAGRPAPTSTNSLLGGAAARAAAEHGKFIAYYDTLFANQPAEGTAALSVDQLKQWGSEVGIDDPAFAERIDTENAAVEQFVGQYYPELVQLAQRELSEAELASITLQQLMSWGGENGVDASFLDGTYTGQLLAATTGAYERYSGQHALQGTPSVYINGALQANSIDIYAPEQLRAAIEAAEPGEVTTQPQ
ncbi:hypothetical protein GCM10022402_46500 [Salinactinospora qingdaonensis]|uniref:non-specific serine/threonine protein kinase n=1 Tax=Salinactinospora qingdaonensis TaxID=702744 RepID=A0ABP7GEQ7_9ACTN